MGVCFDHADSFKTILTNIFISFFGLKISINYVNHVLLVNLRHMGTFKNVFNILIVQIPGLGRTLHLTKDMKDQMVEFGFQVKGES